MFLVGGIIFLYIRKHENAKRSMYAWITESKDRIFIKSKSNSSSSFSSTTKISMIDFNSQFVRQSSVFIADNPTKSEEELGRKSRSLSLVSEISSSINPLQIDYNHKQQQQSL